MKKYLLFFLTLIMYPVFETAGQYPAGYFASPVDIPLRLSGTFGELMNNHFHAGIDIKTYGVEGKKVRAAANGYVSRINVSPYGYGRALYIDHPNGYTTVYAHLQRFNSEIEEYVKAHQYENESFEAQLFPQKGEFAVEQGDLIALSGNTGGSAAPHLHFEIRHTATGEPVNPLLFGYEVSDHIPPDIRALYLYPLDDHSTIDGKNEKKRFRPRKIRTGDYVLNGSLEVHGTIGIGVEAYDQLDKAPNVNGVYRITARKNDEVFYTFLAERFSFAESRYINAHIDMAEAHCCSKKVNRCYLLPGNKLGMYPEIRKRGTVEISLNSTDSLSIEVGDAAGNVSVLNFVLEGPRSVPDIPGDESETGVRLPAEQVNYIQEDGVLAILQEGTLYRDIDFQYAEEEPCRECLTSVYSLHHPGEAVHKYFSLEIDISGIDPRLYPYLSIVRVDDHGRTIYEGGKVNGEVISTKVRSFGKYSVAADSLPPVITPLNIPEGAILRNNRSIRIKARDSESGIAKYRGEINGNWVLMEYDAKNALFIHRFEREFPGGKHRFSFVVEDKKGNISTYSAEFDR